MLDGSIGPTNLSAFFLHRASSSCVYFPREIAPLVLSFSFEATLVDSAEGEDVGNDGPTSGPIAGPTTHLGIGQQGGPMAFLFLLSPIFVPSAPCCKSSPFPDNLLHIISPASKTPEWDSHNSSALAQTDCRF